MSYEVLLTENHLYINPLNLKITASTCFASLNPFVCMYSCSIGGVNFPNGGRPNSKQLKSRRLEPCSIITSIRKQNNFVRGQIWYYRSNSIRTYLYK